jgi:hypothetical protein
MLSPRLTACSDCQDLLPLLEQISCTLALWGQNGLTNVQYQTSLPHPKEGIERLLHYQRILTHRLFNPQYAPSVELTSIIARLKTLGLRPQKDCCQLSQTTCKFSSLP